MSPEPISRKSKRDLILGPILAVLTSVIIGAFFVLSLIQPKAVEVFTGFIGTLVWPAVVLITIFLFRPEFIKVVGRVTEFDAFGVKAKLRDELEQAGTEAEQAAGPAKPPTPSQVERAVEVQRILRDDTSLVQSQVDQLAEEYESIRASMPSGEDRTRQMGVTLAKMRAIALAAYRFRHSLAQSPSPGRRLQAIACLQVNPDFNMLEWLAERIGSEMPFVEYHALVALNVAASSDLAASHRDALKRALSIAKARPKMVGDAADRMALLRDFEKRVQERTEA